jgi:hypothetical protein
MAEGKDVGQLSEMRKAKGNRNSNISELQEKSKAVPAVRPRERRSARGSIPAIERMHASFNSN